MTDIYIERESLEFVIVPLFLDDVQIADDDAIYAELKVQVVPRDTRPISGEWVATTSRAGKTGFQQQPTAGPASFTIFAQVTDSPDVPVIEAGTLFIK